MILQHLKSEALHFDTHTRSFNGTISMDHFSLLSLSLSQLNVGWQAEEGGGLPAGTEIETLRSQPANLKELLPEGEGEGGLQ